MAQELEPVILRVKVDPTEALRDAEALEKSQAKVEKIERAARKVTDTVREMGGEEEESGSLARVAGAASTFFKGRLSVAAVRSQLFRNATRFLPGGVIGVAGVAAVGTGALFAESSVLPLIRGVIRGSMEPNVFRDEVLRIVQESGQSLEFVRDLYESVKTNLAALNDLREFLGAAASIGVPNVDPETAEEFRSGAARYRFAENQAQRWARRERLRTQGENITKMFKAAVITQ
jgi:hypothetical protein